MSRPTLIIPIVFPDPNPLTDSHLQGLAGFDVVLFGYWEVPEGVSPESVRAAHETEAEAVLYELAADFSRAGASTDVHLHFGPAGPEKIELQDRIAEATDADGIMIPRPLAMLNNVLVPLRDDRRRDEIVEFVSAFDPESIFALELYHVARDPDEVLPAEEMLAGVERRLLERGFTESDLEVTVEVDEDPVSAIAERTRRHNVVVMGETEELDAEERFLGPVYLSIADATDTPIVVIRG